MDDVWLANFMLRTYAAYRRRALRGSNGSKKALVRMDDIIGEHFAKLSPESRREHPHLDAVARSYEERGSVPF